ncbi:MAG TPA: four helix bundle protein [Meiothermus sp.]|nr:four helix bundle protein [Meiothermus sp.]
MRFLYQSRGSLLETVSALQIATMLGFLPQAERGRLVAQASRLHAKLNGLIRALD